MAKMFTIDLSSGSSKVDKIDDSLEQTFVGGWEPASGIPTKSKLAELGLTSYTLSELPE